jgi:hypothetical protein
MSFYYQWMQGEASSYHRTRINWSLVGLFSCSKFRFPHHLDRGKKGVLHSSSTMTSIESKVRVSMYCMCTGCVLIACAAEKGGDELQKEDYIRLYDTTASFEVVPVSHILGRLPIMPDFADRTIPHRVSKQQKIAFPLGRCDSTNSTHDGSNLFYVNHFAMTWSRSKTSLFR